MKTRFAHSIEMSPEEYQAQMELAKLMVQSGASIFSEVLELMDRDLDRAERREQRQEAREARQAETDAKICDVDPIEPEEG